MKINGAYGDLRVRKNGNKEKKDGEKRAGKVSIFKETLRNKTRATLISLVTEEWGRESSGSHSGFHRCTKRDCVMETIAITYERDANGVKDLE